MLRVWLPVLSTTGVAAVLAIPVAIGVTAAGQGVAAGVPLFDLGPYLGLVLVLMGASLVGVLGPAVRAAEIHPAEAMRAGA